MFEEPETPKYSDLDKMPEALRSEPPSPELQKLYLVASSARHGNAHSRCALIASQENLQIEMNKLADWQYVTAVQEQLGCVERPQLLQIVPFYEDANGYWSVTVFIKSSKDESHIIRDYLIVPDASSFDNRVAIFRAKDKSSSISRTWQLVEAGPHKVSLAAAIILDIADPEPLPGQLAIKGIPKRFRSNFICPELKDAFKAGYRARHGSEEKKLQWQSKCDVLNKEAFLTLNWDGLRQVQKKLECLDVPKFLQAHSIIHERKGFCDVTIFVNSANDKDSAIFDYLLVPIAASQQDLVGIFRMINNSSGTPAWQFVDQCQIGKGHVSIAESLVLDLDPNNHHEFGNPFVYCCSNRKLLL